MKRLGIVVGGLAKGVGDSVYTGKIIDDSPLFFYLMVFHCITRCSQIVSIVDRHNFHNFIYIHLISLRMNRLLNDHD